MQRLYLAGGLFNAGERLHNLYLEKHLVPYGYEIILPQREALRFFKGDAFDTRAIVRDCRRLSLEETNIIVVCADGADADSGTCVEYGMAVTATGRAVVYRTDFRTAMEKELGVNAMLTAEGTTFIYRPCFFTSLSEVEDYYHSLAEKIHEAVKKILAAEAD